MSIPMELIDPDAEKIVRRLHRYGHRAYLVGGCVRDLLLGRTPKDFDIATSATPSEIKDLFRNCRIIGRRFRLAHIFFGSKIIETSTFRSNPREGQPLDEEDEILIRRDNVFGTAEEDARRRDFTINGLFYDIEAGEVIDYVGGLADLEARLVRTIGDPDIRFREDPVRILRAIKFAARLRFQVESSTRAAIFSHRGEIPKCAPPRVLEEIYRLLRGGAANASMELLLETSVALTLSPELAWIFGGQAQSKTAEAGVTPVEAEQPSPSFQEESQAPALGAQARRLLETLDELVCQGGVPMSPPTRGATPSQQPSNALLLAVLVAPLVPRIARPESELERTKDLSVRIEEAIRPIALRLHVSRRDAERTRQLMLLAHRLAPPRKRRSRPMSVVKRDHFLEALAFYELICRARDQDLDEVEYWRSLWRKTMGIADGEEAEGTQVDEAEAGANAGISKRRRRRRRGGRKRRRGEGDTVEQLALGSDKPRGADENPEAPALLGNSSPTRRE
ncbi:MAG: polynucleotide adenylyltransferase PcnB [Deltaproteobacteria bacterium]|nr:polynucleotide adenylyltransferase PcnB [Deltaproteobacteria bacterium]